MNTIPSNSKFKPKLLKYLLTLLIILTAVQFTNPITAYANTSTNITSFNGEAEHGYGARVGKLHWAGSTTRTGFIFYFVTKSSSVLTTDDLGLTNARETPIILEIIKEDYKTEMLKATDFRYYLKYPISILGRVTYQTASVVTLYPANVPPAVKWDDNTGRWSGNGVAVAEWLFSECEDGAQTWEKILRDGLAEYTRSSQEIDLVIEDLRTQENLNIVIEPIAANAIYSTQKWGDEATTIRLDVDTDADFYEYIHPSNYKPALKKYYDDDSVFYRILRASDTAHHMSQLVYEITAENGDPCPKGGANSRWTNEALPFCMTLQEDALDKKAISTSIKPHIISYEEINKEDLSYGMGLLSKTIKFDFISTYDGTSEKPAPSEQPVDTPDKNTTGECTITKIYFDKEVDGLTGTITYKYIDTFTTKNTTGYINLVFEGKSSGYIANKWAATIEEQDYSSYYKDSGYNSLVAKFSEATISADASVRKFFMYGTHEEEGNLCKCKHLYILYTKTTTIPAPEVEDYDFEIPESYITKQIYFQQGLNTSNTNNTAQKLILNQFQWTSAAHTLCPGHKVIDCGKIQHAHIPYVDNPNPGCYTMRALTVKSCSGTNQNCSAYHIHSDENCKELAGYKCVKCGATGDTESKVKKSTLHKNCKGTITKVFGEYKDKAYKCVQCSAIYDTKPSGCSNCPGTTFIDACGIAYHNCVDDTKTIYNLVVACGLDEHTHNLDCFAKTVYCSPTWSDAKISLSIKNIKQSNYPNILATNADWSTIVEANEALKLALGGNNLIAAKLYGWVENERDTTDADTQKQSFDYTTILLRGADELTLPEWKKDYVNVDEKIDQPTVMNNLTGANSISSTKFKVGNTPQGTRKYATYEEVFSAAFKDDSEDKETVLSFNYPSGVSSSTLEWIQNIIPIRNFLKCSNNSKVYQFSTDTTFEIPSIKVKVNVFSDYTNQNPGTPIHGDTTISFYPYVRMYYDTPSLKNQSALVLGETQRQFQAHDGADITFTNGTGQLTLTTSQWYLAKMI